MWLENGLNSKQIFTRLCLLFSLFFIFNLYLDQRVSLIFLGVVFSYCIWIAYQLLVKGFFILLTTKKIGRATYQVRSRFFPLNLSKSYREIASAQLSGFASRSAIFNSQGKNDLFFLEIIRDLTQSLSLKKILILGGAGCSLASFFAKQKSIQNVDVIEYNPIMIELANKYFLKKNEKINLIHGNGLNYTKYCADIYDLVIIDMFDGPILKKGVINESFIRKVKKSITESGFFIMNLGYSKEINSVIKTWQNFFSLYIYLSHSNFLISNIKCGSFKFNSSHRFLFEIPQLIED